ncbi:hypothetical protein CDL12_01008 [Handroanthus impetiginosus]|uniref:Retrotransposon gag domain-containing protein n=1 Tax=Handroanthus impetiginosus TaxID=429701 RepID=A0A2G9I908_9LAMI|nr:hypothetical protein CDL12_01008 [Handroanthus impetiginosus]
MAGTSAVDDQLAHMAQAIVDLHKVVEDKDHQIAQLMSKLEHSHIGESSHNHQPHPRHAEEFKRNEETPYQQVPGPRANQSTLSVGALTVEQLQDMITSTIRAQYGGPSQSSLAYSKPYTKRIDSLRMPIGYQPPKFQQFDGKGNPKQHVAHFIETCSNAGTNGDLLVKQFVRSLKGNAFDWFIKLEPESIDSWDQMEREFLNRFSSTRRTVSMIELINTKQWKYEPVVDYINRWRTLSLNCKDRLSEISAIEMCIQGMHWGLLYILQGIKLHTFEELATWAHDIELSMANHGVGHPMEEKKKDKNDFKKSEKNMKTSTKESMAVKAATVKFPTTEKKNNDKIENQRASSSKRTLKEMQEKEYPFPDSDVPHIFDELLARRLIELPQSKRLEEMGKTNDPKYCKYHRVVSHPIEKCFVFKDKIMSLVQEGKILKTSTKESMAVKAATVKFPTMEKKNNDKVENQRASSGKQTLKEMQEKEYPFPDSDVPHIFDELLARKLIELPQPKRPEEVEKTNDPKYCKYHRVMSHPIEKCFVFKDKIMALAKEGKIIRDTEDVANASLISVVVTENTKELLEHEVKTSYTISCEEENSSSVPCCTTISFTDEDLLLGSKPHNRPLFVSRFMQEQKVNCILIDGGSAVNIMPKSTMKRLGILAKDLSRSRLTIQGFNQDGQKAIGMIRLDLMIGELKASTLFHVIDARTSYHLLLGRPWLHENGVIPSTLHQCFKYVKEGVIVKVGADTKPFTDAESYFADAKLYLDLDSVKEVLPLKISSFNQDGQRAIGMIRLYLMIGELKASTLFHIIDARTSYHLLLGRPWLHENGVIPSTLHQCFKYVKEGSYKLLEKSGFDFASPPSLGKLQPELTGEKIHGLTEKQQELRK